MNKAKFFKTIFMILLIDYELLQGLCAVINPPECGRRINEIRGRRSNKIVNGQESDPEDWGWQVLINGLQSICGGSLINAEWVLTAAHCVDYLDQLILPEPSFYTLQLGLSNRIFPEPFSVTRTVSKIIVHPQYDNSKLQTEGLQNDVALLKLSEPVQFTDQILPICLLERNADFSNQMALATGWGGLYGNGPTAYNLMEINIPIYNDSFCTKEMLIFNLKYNANNCICAGEYNKVTCQGDSGGPLVVKVGEKWMLAGITSYGPEGCKEETAFAKTSYFVDWIKNSVQENSSSITRFEIIYLAFFFVFEFIYHQH